MALSNYTELKTSLGFWLGRTDLSTLIPDFISLFEAYARAEIHTPEMETTGTVTVTAGSSSAALPADFLRMRNVTLNTAPVVTLMPLSPTVMSQRYAYQGAGQPRAYSIVGTNLVVDRPTDADYTISLDYTGALTALSDNNPTNWLLTKYPNAYLYGSLLQAAPYMGADARISTWASFVDRAIEGINTQGVLQQNPGPVMAQLTGTVP